MKLKNIVMMVLGTLGASGACAGIINYTFDEEGGALLAEKTDIGNTTVSLISYIQGTTASGAGTSAVAYESNVPGDNLFAISSTDMDGANASYQANDSRFEFDFTVGVGQAMSFTSATLDFDLLAMDASALNNVVNARLFYRVNSGSWVDASGGYHQIFTVSAPLDHTLNTNLVADFTDEPLIDSVASGANVYENNFSVDLSSIGILSAGDNVEFALFVWDAANDNTSFYGGVDNIQAAGIIVESLPVPAGNVDYNYSFDETNANLPSVSSDVYLTASEIQYIQGSEQSGGGASEIAYESNVPGDNLFAVSSADIGGANLSYQATDSRLEFSLTVELGSADFTGVNLTYDLFNMNATENIYRINSLAFYSIDGTSWVRLADAFQYIVNNDASSYDATHVLNNELYADSTDTNLTGSILAGATVYEKQVSYDLSDLGKLTEGDTVKFAVFLWDNGVNGSLSYYAGVDNIQLNGIAVGPIEVVSEILGFSSVSSNVFKMVFNSSAASETFLLASDDLVSGAWTNIAHSVDGNNPFVVTNLGYSGVQESNRVIYIKSDQEMKFFGLY